MDHGQNAPSRPSGHTRNVSSRARRQAAPRESAIDPLAANDSIVSPSSQDSPSSLPASSPATSPPPKRSYALSPAPPTSPPPTRSYALSPPPSSSQSARTASRSPAPPPVVVERPLSSQSASSTGRDFSYLIQPSNFHNLSSSDVPTPFRIASSYPPTPSSLQNLLQQGRFRAAAALAALLLAETTNPTDHQQVFSLLYVRLVCLQLAGLHEFAAQESKVLQDLNAAFYFEADGGECILPWELRVLGVRLQAQGFGDWRRGIMGLYELAREARIKVKEASVAAEKSVWRDRLEDLGVRVANTLVEMGDIEGAIRHLKGLPTSNNTVSRTRIALLQLRIGDVLAATETVTGALPAADHEEPRPVSVRVLEALVKMAGSSYEEAISIWRQLKEASAMGTEYHATILQNLAVCLVYEGRINEAQEILGALVDEKALNRSVLFNLATIYELCSDKSKEAKMTLAEKLASQDVSSTGWERGNADLKL